MKYSRGNNERIPNTLIPYLHECFRDTTYEYMGGSALIGTAGRFRK